jgi:anaerobic C4-dicarboxylate transporter DcuB
MEFQEKLKDPKQREFIYGGTETLMNQRFPKQAYWSTWIFFAGIAVVVLLGAFPELRPAFELKGKMTALSMNLVIQMMMLIAGAVMLMACKVNASAISNGAVFKAGMVAIFSVFGVAWMSDTFFQAHLDELKLALEGVVKSHPWICHCAVSGVKTGEQPGGGADGGGADGVDAWASTRKC